MSAHNPIAVYVVERAHHDASETQRVVGFYFTWTAARRACDAYRTDSGQRWTSWSTTRNRDNRVLTATCETQTGDNAWLSVSRCIVDDAHPLGA